jgi:hypothetical protein
LLLPGLRSNRIAVAGAPDDELRAALRLLAEEVRHPRTAAEWQALSGTCDVVVLASPTPADLGPASEALRPGGWLYAEVHRRAARTAGGPPSAAQVCRTSPRTGTCPARVVRPRSSRWTR